MKHCPDLTKFLPPREKKIAQFISSKSFGERQRKDKGVFLPPLIPTLWCRSWPLLIKSAVVHLSPRWHCGAGRNSTWAPRSLCPRCSCMDPVSRNEYIKQNRPHCAHWTTKETVRQDWWRRTIKPQWLSFVLFQNETQWSSENKIILSRMSQSTFVLWGGREKKGKERVGDLQLDLKEKRCWHYKNRQL